MTDETDNRTLKNINWKEYKEQHPPLPPHTHIQTNIHTQNFVHGVVIVEVNKGKPSVAAAVLVIHNVDAGDTAKVSKVILQVLLFYILGEGAKDWLTDWLCI